MTTHEAQTVSSVSNRVIAELGCMLCPRSLQVVCRSGTKEIEDYAEASDVPVQINGGNHHETSKCGLAAVNGDCPKEAAINEITEGVQEHLFDDVYIV